MPVRAAAPALASYRGPVGVFGSIPTGNWTVQPIDAHTSQLDAGAQTADLLAVYLGALDLDFHIDPDQAPELAHAAHRLAERYAAAPR